MGTPAAANDPISIFISYAHEDEQLCQRLISHLRVLSDSAVISHWSDARIIPGERWDAVIRSELISAKIVLLLVSSDFLNSDYVNMVELRTALARHNSGEAWTIPVILRPCDWTESVLRNLQALPSRGKPISTWDNEDEALLDVVRGIRAVVERLSVAELPGPVTPRRRRVEQRRDVTRPGILRHVLDRYFPSLHRLLTNFGNLDKPSETDDLNKYLREVRADIENDIRHKTYIPLTGKEVSAPPLHDDAGTDPFVPPIQRVIRQIVGRENGGDSASAQIAAVNRRSRVIRDIIRTLLESSDPLVLLGDPGTGKTMTLQQAALRLFDSEIKRVFPVVTLYVRLGEFYVAGPVTPDHVWKYVKASVSPKISPYLDALDSADRLVVLFDGMDEMSRERYSEHTEALSIFAAARKGRTRTLFSCRITDFSPRFLHRRLVLLPFNDGQIGEYLRRYIPSFPLKIEGEAWTLKRLVRELLRGTLPLEATNPFVLWLLCYQLQQRGSWPASRVELLRYYIEETYRRKSKALDDDETPFPPVDPALAGWSKFAYTITNSNRGSAIAVSALVSDNGLDVDDLIRVGKRCGVLQESLNENERQIRFEHHRFQEFFTALFINQRQTEVLWLDKLDAPRWQETMVNLILMGGGEDAISTLTEAIEEGIPLGPGSTLGLEKNIPGNESLVADRIELASRIIRQAGSSSTLLATALTSTFEKAIRFFSEHGNPITQVKMMRACQNVPQVDIFQVLQKSLKSPINWVRNQALIIVSSSNRGPLATGSHFATELGYDLANGLLPLRVKAYCKAAAASKQKRNWWCVAVASFAYLTNITLLMTLAAALFFGAWWVLTVLLSYSIDARIFSGVCVSLMAAGTGLSLKFNPGVLWMSILGISGVSLALTLLIWSSTLGFVGLIVFLIAGSVAGMAALGLIGIPIALATHSLGLMSYLAATAPVRHSEVGLKSYFRAMWKNCGFDDGFDYTIEAVSQAAELVGIVLGGLALTALLQGAALLADLLNLPFSTPVNVVLILLATILMGVVFVAVRRKQLSFIPKAFGYLLLVVAALPILFGVFVGIGFVVAWIGPYFWRWIQSLNEASMPISSYFQTVLVVVVGVLLIAGWLFTFWLFLPKLRALLAATREPTNRPISAERWKLQLLQAGPDQQQSILNQTNHQNLGLKADEFLKVLEEVAPTISEEPALSTYWEKRDRLEQVLKQERQG